MFLVTFLKLIFTTLPIQVLVTRITSRVESISCEHLDIFIRLRVGVLHILYLLSIDIDSVIDLDVHIYNEKLLISLTFPFIFVCAISM